VTVAAGAMTDDQLVEQLAALLKEYVARVQASPPGPLPTARWATRLNATESVLVAVDLLRAAEITSFELAAMFNI
jgi:hypothetical protein